MIEIIEPYLTDGAVKLRRWRLEDLSLVEKASSDPDLLTGTTLPARYSSAQGRAFIERQWGRASSREGMSLAIEADGAAVGCSTVMLRRQRVGDLGFWLIREARGRRIGATAVGLLTPWALEHLEIDSLDAFVDEGNAPSRRLLERAGYRLLGLERHTVNRLDAELLVYRRTRLEHDSGE